MSLKYETYYKVSSNTVLRYYRHGRVHRKNSPSVVYMDGDMFWHQLGKLHRPDGPASISGEVQRFFIVGIEYTREEYEYKIRSKSIRK